MEKLEERRQTVQRNVVVSHWKSAIFALVVITASLLLSIVLVNLMDRFLF